MPTEAERQIAAALDATPELLPYLPALLADLWDLGSSPALVTDWLRELKLDPQTRVLDLGCGKGAVSLTLAREFGFRVHGVDLFEPFLEEARARAARWGVASRCRFERGDLREVVRAVSGYDVVVYASVGVLGPLDACVVALRRCVRRAGCMVIEDGCLAGAAPEAGFESYADLEESRRRLASRADAILRERVRSREEMRALDDGYIRSIRARANSLAAAHPEQATLIRGYVEQQQRAAAAWERNALSVGWLLRRA
jgi:SAM-dependent methyltransferase